MIFTKPKAGVYYNQKTDVIITIEYLSANCVNFARLYIGANRFLVSEFEYACMKSMKSYVKYIGKF